MNPLLVPIAEALKRTGFERTAGQCAFVVEAIGSFSTIRAAPAWRRSWNRCLWRSHDLTWPTRRRGTLSGVGLDKVPRWLRYESTPRSDLRDRCSITPTSGNSNRGCEDLLPEPGRERCAVVGPHRMRDPSVGVEPLVVPILVPDIDVRSGLLVGGGGRHANIR